ncbi:hypothetical protein TRIUR3_08161 [Triticum urartu]|uniref:Uncharacterized protein n=1 Tax=Triticum urartu TaxID=4572 RepID=M7YHS9_TRIUA|nr:hypothetical protein TRIUR3_08161 [Triticum urartu]
MDAGAAPAPLALILDASCPLSRVTEAVGLESCPDARGSSHQAIRAAYAVESTKPLDHDAGCSDSRPSPSSSLSLVGIAFSIVIFETQDSDAHEEEACSIKILEDGKSRVTFIRHESSLGYEGQYDACIVPKNAK